jgi:hypothetical protein
MAGAERLDRLQQYLRELSPQARLLLISEFERSLLGGDQAAGADLVLQQMRCIVREQREGAPRVGHCARLFFKAVEAFLVDERADHNHPGRIARCSLEPLWTWTSRDLLPEDAKAFIDAANDAILAGDEAKARQLTRGFQDKVAARITEVAADEDQRTYRRMLAQIGTPRAAEDLTILKCALKARDALERLVAQLPLRIANLAGAELDRYKALIETTGQGDDDVFLCALLTVMGRLTAPWQVIRFGIKAAGSDVAARVAQTGYGIAVTIVLSELERQVGELRADLRSGAGVAVGALLKTIHDSARGLRTELDLPIDSTWGRALAGLRAQIAELLRSEIESAPGRMRRLLRPRPSNEIRANSVLDAQEVAETEALIAFVGNCRYFAGELALNEMTQRTFSDLQHFLDNGMRALLDGVRHAGDADRSFRQSQLDAAARFCAKVFGKDYAALLTRAAEVAGADRKAS